MVNWRDECAPETRAKIAQMQEQRETILQMWDAGMMQRRKARRLIGRLTAAIAREWEAA